jgi:glyoxylase-like metal-dependent hydrolase (beta-lactamase superfamily II)
VPDGYFDRIYCGDAVVTRIASVRRLWFRPPYLVSDDALRAAVLEADGQSRLPLDFTTLHIAMGDLSVVVDPGRLTADQRERYREADLTPGVSGALATLRIDRREVTHVIVSHAHTDHFSGITDDDEGTVVAYPNARHVMSKIEWDRARGEDKLFRRLTDAVHDLGLVDLAGGDLEVALGLSLLATPGETPGHFSVRLRSGGSALYWIGDLVHHSIEFEHPDWVMAGGDAQALRSSRDQIFREAAASDAMVVWAHAPMPGWGRVEVNGDAYRWRPLPPEVMPGP